MNTVRACVKGAKVVSQMTKAGEGAVAAPLVSASENLKSGKSVENDKAKDVKADNKDSLDLSSKDDRRCAGCTCGPVRRKVCPNRVPIVAETNDDNLATDFTSFGLSKKVVDTSKTKKE